MSTTEKPTTEKEKQIQQIQQTQTNQNIKQWAHGLLAVCVSYAANAIITSALIPEATVESILKAAGVQAVLGIALYMKRNELPQW